MSTAQSAAAILLVIAYVVGLPYLAATAGGIVIGAYFQEHS